jgi:hypothetical protein
MGVLKPRSRLVHFRMSEEEFQKIQHLCHVTGARSISDVARAAVQKFIAEPETESACEEWKAARESLENVVADLLHRWQSWDSYVIHIQPSPHVIRQMIRNRVKRDLTPETTSWRTLMGV